jgi:acyl carrier protein
MRTAEFLDSVCCALGRAPSTIGLDDSPTTVEEWDSIGHLCILSTIDEKLDVPMEDEDLRTFSSIRELVERLRARKALED